MKFGLHYLLSCAETQSPIQRYQDTLEQATRGEALGFESVWPVEQHFNRNISILPCPALLLAAIAARTRTLRLGTAIVQLPLAHPLRVAEELATLDVLSGGRVECGVGRGANPTHFAGFGMHMAESRDRMVEALAYIRQAFTQERFSFQGRFFQADDISLAPRPLQQPHPPIRIAANSTETAEWAGRSGYPIIVASNINPFPKLHELVAIHRTARREARHDATGGDDLTILMPLYVGENRSQIGRDVAPSVQHYAHLAASLVAPALAKSGSEAEQQKLQALLEQLSRLTYETVNDVSAIFDTPEACVERLQQVQEEFNPGRVICWFNFGGLVAHERVLRSMELFSARVLPRV
jgi:alkanesulfonate monooxygenase SsuD/methylene tetrahydromethanopterin reductase-like flavin-dependent oxidoreductase (luciferase family)